MTQAYYDFAIIGAGILGCNLAYQLSRAYPQKSIVIFDMNQVGAGCTGYAGAIASPLVSSDVQRSASKFSKDWYSNYLENENSRFIRHLPCVIVSRQSELSIIQQRCEQFVSTATASIPSWLLTAETDCLYQGGVALQADAKGLCMELLSKSSGVEVFEGTKIREVYEEGSCWTLVAADSRRISCGQLFTATGPWLDSFHEVKSKAPNDLSAEHKIRRKKVVAYVIDRPAVEADSLIYFIDDSSFLLPDPTNNRWIMSITSEQWDCLPTSNQLYANEQELVLAKSILKHHCPELITGLRGARVHCDGYSVERLPVSVQLFDKHIRLAGGSGSGFRYAPKAVFDAMSMLTSR